ncbi:MAG TPA: lamin tail domain-containing protein [Candidatus Limnocylindria bacterium]|nr:lamin tail domain-containing protein [Candidatus Limnocylindria bacterium]
MAAVSQARAVWLASEPGPATTDEAAGHLVVSELLAGAASASDEFVELFNPSPASLPLEGLEVVYVSASGATVTRKAAWSAGASSLPAGAHLLLANEAGAYASLADATYAGGLAATGGSVALRIQGASVAIDALGWGTAASTWLEGAVAPAVAAGSSLERLPGGADGSFQDTDDNLVDFVMRAVPDPQNSASPAVPGAGPSPTPAASPTPPVTPTPGAAATPTPAETATATPAATATPSASPAPTSSPAPTPSPAPTATPSAVISIADARAIADGATVTVAGVALSDAAFTEGGGYLADETGGLAVLLSDGGFSRGRLIQVTGVLDTRYQQRTLRAAADDVVDLGPGSEPAPLNVSTGSVSEGVEAILVRVNGEIVSSATSLTAGLAFDVDDGSGPVRVLVADAAGIDTAAWERGAMLGVVGVVGQRDATGTGTSGYRVQPRDATDVELTPPPNPAPTPTPAPSSTPTPTGTPEPSGTPAPGSDGTPLLSIAQARALSSGAHVRVRGVVTMATRLIDPTTAVIQDASAAIVVRVSGSAGTLRRGQLVELVGTRSTKSGMLTIRITDPPRQLGAQPEPAPVRRPTGALGEDLEAQLVVARGALTAKPQRSSTGNVSFAIDDGSGETRVMISPASGISLGTPATGTWIEVRGALGQETSGSQPLRGYRIWPRDGADLDVLAGPLSAGTLTGNATNGSSGRPEAAPARSGSVRLRPTDRATDTDASSGLPNPRGAGLGPGAGSARGSGATDSRPNAAGAIGPVRADAARDQLPVVIVLGLALTALAGLALVGWRDGAFHRLDALARGAGPADEGARQADSLPDLGATDDATQGMPRLSVVRIPQEPRAP